MKIALVCYVSTPTSWIVKHIVELESKLNFYIKNKIENFDQLNYSFYMGIIYVNQSNLNSMLPRKLKHNKVKKYYEFDALFVPNEFSHLQLNYLNKRIIDELLININKLEGDGDLHKELLNCIDNFYITEL
jgi:hypothetical protein